MMVILLLQQMPVAEAAAAKAKVTASSARLFKSTKSSKTYTTLKKGTMVTVVKEGSKWIKCKAKGKTGYVLKKNLKKQKATSKKIASKKKKKPTLRTLRSGSKGSAVKKVQSKLASKGYLGKSSVNGKYGSGTAHAVREFQLINGLSASGAATVSTQKKLFSGGAHSLPNISMTSWSKCDINSRFRIHGGMATIVDMKTGTRIRIRRLYGSNHCDVEPATKADTAKLKRIYGGKWSWDSRGVLLIAGGKCYAAAINSMPHGGQISRSNGYPGQFCLHLKDSKTHGSSKENAAHQANIRKVYNYFH